MLSPPSSRLGPLFFGGRARLAAGPLALLLLADVAPRCGGPSGPHRECGFMPVAAGQLVGPDLTEQEPPFIDREAAFDACRDHGPVCVGVNWLDEVGPFTVLLSSSGALPEVSGSRGAHRRFTCNW